MRTARPSSTRGTSDQQGEDRDFPLPEGRDFPLPVGRVRLHPMQDVDFVIFVAECPSCGQDAEWIEEREDTRLRVTIACSRCH